jgi:hypothetical protein
MLDVVDVIKYTEMELVKRQDRYDLYGSDGSKIASSDPNPFGKLSKENCDEIFGVVDVERLANETFTETNPSLKEYEEGLHIGFKEGFLKAMELNKDKVFTVEDIKKAIAFGWDYEGLTKDEMLERYNFKLEYNNSYAEDTDKFIQSLQQPTEIEVEIEQVLTQSSIEGDAIWKYKLDENGCVILIKK